MLRRCSSSGDVCLPQYDQSSSGACALTASPVLHCKIARGEVPASRNAAARAEALELLRSTSDFADRHGTQRSDSEQSECGGADAAQHVCRLLACSSPLAYRGASYGGPQLRAHAPARRRQPEQGCGAGSRASEAAAADARASKALSAARAMAVEAQARGGAASGSGRSSLEGVATSMDGSAMSDSSTFDADGRCHSPGSFPVHAGICARPSADMEIDSSCGRGEGAHDRTLALGHPSDSDAQAVARASGGGCSGSLRTASRAGSLRSMCTDLHDMGTLLGAPSDSLAESDDDSEGDPSESGAVASTSAAGGFMSERQAAVELFFRLNHARQTVDFVKRQAALSVPLRRATLRVWDALDLLGTLREYETALLEEEGLDPTLALHEHAAQTAEACRAAFPDLDWLHLVGLLHSLGKLLAHKRFGGEPQWAVCGESFPVGCRFSGEVVCAQFFSVNPDRRRRLYSTPAGMYRPGCGLAGTYMSWSAAEYLYMVLLLNRTRLPPEALFIVRHQKFAAAERGAYDELLSPSDRALLPWLPRFRELARYKRRPAPPGGHLADPGFREYYGRLIAKYIPGGVLRF